MLPSSLESYQSAKNRWINPTIATFDSLIEQGNLDDAEAVIQSYVDELAERSRINGYENEFFHASLKEIAMPMYRMHHADNGGEQFYGSRELVRNMFNRVEDLMTYLHSFQPLDDSLLSDTQIGLNAHMSDLRGDLSELTVFGILASQLKGYADDFIVMPSESIHDAGPISRGGVHTGYDFLVIDRENDASTKLQVKTSTNQTRKYRSDIKTIALRSLAAQSATTIHQLELAIAAGDRNNPAIKRAYRHLSRVVRNP